MIQKILGVIVCVCLTHVLFAEDIKKEDSPPSVTRSAGLHPFGLKFYKDVQLPHYPFANPDAPQCGELTLGWIQPYTNKNPMAIGGAPMPGYWLCFETLAEGCLLESDRLSSHGLLAEWFEIPEDHKSMTVKLRDDAYFSDGKPVTADDVIFSWNITADPGYLPTIRLSLKDVASIEKIDEKTVKFHFSGWGRELPITLAANIYILPRHIYGRPGTSFGKDFTDMNPVGSGPYVVEKDDPSAFVTLRKNPNYWGRKLWYKRGRYNFERVTYKIFAEARTLREALKAGQVDLDDISSARDWATEFNTPHVKDNLMIKESFPSSRIPSLQCFVFNVRRDVFKDIRVRKAISAVFDFESLNRNLFYDTYERNVCFYDVEHIRAKGAPKGIELDALMDLRRRYNVPDSNLIYVPKAAITSAHRNMDCDIYGNKVSIEDRIRLAEAYLESAGWVMDPVKKVRVNARGEVLRFEVLLCGDGFQRVLNPFFENLERIGVSTTYKAAQPPEYQDRLDKYDYDMIVHTFFPSPCPGVELNFDWSSSSARVKASKNMCGVENPAMDELIRKIECGKTPEEVYFYAKIFDRIIWSNYYFIPQWYSGSFRAVYWNKFGKTDVFMGEAYASYNAYNFWWYDEKRATSLQNALRNGGTLEAPPLMKLESQMQTQTPQTETP